MTARSRKWMAVGAAGAVAMLGTLASTTSVATANAKSHKDDGQKGQKGKAHVLLISVDGLHQSDLQQYVKLHPESTLAKLSEAGTTYTNASTTSPSDSFPGMLAPLTGGTPKSNGVFYDDSYDRTYFMPPAQTATSTQDCKGTPGAETQYFENLDVNAPSTANGGVGSRTILGETIDPAQLPRDKNCQPVYPNDFLRTNTVFSVAHQAGLKTAWSDKHLAYQLVNGHGTPNAVDDLFTPEINADIIPPTLTDTRGKTITFPFPNPTGDNNGILITDYVGDTEAYDQIKVDGILNEIDGKTSGGQPGKGAPNVFGMNFQSVSVGQKTVDPTICNRGATPPCPAGFTPGGYKTDGSFTAQLDGVTTYPNGVKTPGAINFVDHALGQMVQGLKANHLYDSTQIIIEAKHGQSPIDPTKLAKIGHAEAQVLTDAGINPAQVTDDDVALIWLADQSQTAAAVAALNASKAGTNPAHIDQVLSGDQLTKLYQNPLTDSRTPDIVVLPTPGTIYSGSTAKVAEHGGFSPDDTHVALLVVNGGDEGGGTVGDHVTTTQIAPTILRTLGLDPQKLDAVRMEGTKPLPGAGE